MNITVATSIKYGNYKRLWPSTMKVAQLVKSHLGKLCKEFDVEKNIEIHIRPIKGSTHGRAVKSKNRIEIDPRYTIERILETIAHEFTHFEQYKQGRLKYSAGESVWEGRAYRRATTHQRYLNQPWEIEARERATQYVAKYAS